ncbi:hypothetical protein ACFL2G_03790 [Candidatus Omnitrophota bacterium]
MHRTSKKLGEILMEKGLINQEQLDDSLNEQKTTKEFLGAILLKNGHIEEQGLFQALSEQFRIPFISIEYKYIDWDFVSHFSSSLILDCKCFPIQINESMITVAIVNPLDVWALKKVEQATIGYSLRLVLVCESDMKEVISRYKDYTKGRHR